jgi:hypothetical protein
LSFLEQVLKECTPSDRVSPEVYVEAGIQSKKRILMRVPTGYYTVTDKVVLDLGCGEVQALS